MSDPALPPYAEAFSNARDGAGTGLVLAQIDAVLSARKGQGDGPILWVQDRRAMQEAGLPCLRGIAETGLTMPILRVGVRGAAEALWAMEEGLECVALSAVVGEVWGNPKALDFTATKRLSLRAARTGVPVWLLRQDAVADLSVAPDRWRVVPSPSPVNSLDAQAPGAPRWMAELFRTRRRAPGRWVATHDRATHRLDLAAAVSDGTVGTGAGDAPRPRPRAVG
ncbi:hypothetical protein MWU52_15030 [Jannaschia sp. S6380]|uniref:ImuA family protein n=1 Tax=Jannaschia sp. S6380 TaxID=2926408 RepID=UPI001FF5F84D|nr:hypothetical protein [Jannaschia sp. S6380]MCK0168866.1 hypothetical protein [Jannaschia sp. S6380]